MGLFSFFKEWGNNSSHIKESDIMMTRFSGVNRFSYSIDSYRLGMEYVQKFQDKIIRSGGEQLTVAEFSLIRLAVLASIAIGSDVLTSPLVPDVPRESFMKIHLDAVERIRSTYENEIRPTVVLEVKSILNSLYTAVFTGS